MAAPVQDIPVVILCGGFGTRIREASERLPKPLIQIGERPILWHIMKVYAHHGFRRFVLALGYKSWDIKDFFLHYRERNSDLTLQLADGSLRSHGSGLAEDWEITMVESGLLTGTGGRIGRVAPYIDTDHFALTYGDGIGDVDLTAEWQYHLSHGAIGTVTGVHPTSRFGEMGVDGSSVTSFAEKPVTQGFVSGGFFFFRRGFLDYVSSDEDLFLEREPLRRLADDGELRVAEHRGFWMGMDTFRDYSELNELWTSGNAPWKVWAD